ncbi:MAG: hypothetical protein Q4B68_01590 [Bacteroidales bacterium]|nr:hypothetical protein [Bacteroidales bacterium]
MKKLFSMLMLSMMLLGMTSCLNDDPGTSEATFTVSMYNRTVTAGAGDVSEFSVNNYTYLVNYTKGVISVNVTATISGNNTIQFNLTELPLTADQSMQAYRFSCPSASAQGLQISDLKGVIDINHGVVYVTFAVDGDKTVHATGSLPFMFNETEYTSIEGKTITTKNCMYDFRINKSKMTATLWIQGFIPIDGENKEVDNLIAVFDELKVEFTRDGYRISSPSTKASTANGGNVNDAVLTNVEFNIHSQGIRFSGSYNTKSYTATVTGKMFNENLDQ